MTDRLPDAELIIEQARSMHLSDDMLQAAEDVVVAMLCADGEASTEEEKAVIKDAVAHVTVMALPLIAEVREHRAREAAHRAAPPEPEPDPRESLPDDMPVAHGWVMAKGWIGGDLFRPEGEGRFTRWFDAIRLWGSEGFWYESNLPDPRPATVGDLRRLGVPVSEWPDITAPELVEPPDRHVVLVDGEARQRFKNDWYAVGEGMPYTWAEVCAQGTPTVIHTPKETR